MEFTRESIFVHSVRSFFSSLFVLLGVAVGLFLVVLGLSFFSAGKMLPERATVTILPDAQGNRDMLSYTAPVILRLDVHGVIGMTDLLHENVETVLLDSREGLLQAGRVKAILLHLNTPGGTDCDSDEIYRALVAYKKKYTVPVYAYVDCICASGGMYIACAADKIYASPTAVVGSVGVVMGPAFNFSQAMEKVGVQALTLSEGKDKDSLNPFRPWQQGEDESFRVILSHVYNRFVNVVTEARPRIDKAKLQGEYGAHVFIASEAEEYGYIDRANSSYNEALADLAKEAGIGEKYQVVRLQLPKSFLEELVQGRLFSGKLTHRLDLGAPSTPELAGKFLYLYQPGRG